ncbi:8-oxo-dGTP diphosphatase [Saccharomonospora amisosensis]|uniref:8-oxo-dGTP diphosphatase n=1 Tax=Saccharomonospora amisosensis TaxID=1128677 RepID=A0A7X5UPY5_9PSEU|nr:NUDIX hydrolase [Saccharomonospora amisosensis]NIJ11594.1 8-oxo-dGTP diphosphatase [Saccharomonospora amisosensis]
MTDTRDEVARLTADVVLFARTPDTGPRVLLIRRGWPPFEGRWALPGGHVDLGETTEAAAVRELAEETGIRIGTPLALSGVYADPGRDPRGRYVTVAYTCQVGRVIPAVAADDATAARWFPVTDVLAEPGLLAFDHHAIVTDALQRGVW